MMTLTRDPVQPLRIARHRRRHVGQRSTHHPRVAQKPPARTFRSSLRPDLLLKEEPPRGAARGFLPLAEVGEPGRSVASLI
jgi:hypothetical protein